MKASTKFSAVALALGLAFGAAASAHWGGGMGPGSGPGAGNGPGCMMGGAYGAQLFTAEEQAALREQMRNAKTPEERIAAAQAHRTELQRRATERGITLPDCPGPGAGPGARAGTGPFAGRGPGGRW